MRCPDFRPAKAMHSAGLRSASRSRSACGRAGSATAAAMALGTTGGSAAPADARVAKQMAAASVAVDRWRMRMVMMISPFSHSMITRSDDSAPSSTNSVMTAEVVSSSSSPTSRSLLTMCRHRRPLTEGQVCLAIEAVETAPFLSEAGRNDIFYCNAVRCKTLEA